MELRYWLTDWMVEPLVGQEKLPLYILNLKVNYSILSNVLHGDLLGLSNGDHFMTFFRKG